MLPQVGNQLIPSTLTTTVTAGNDAIVMNLFDKLQLAGYTYHILSSFCFFWGGGGSVMLEKENNGRIV